MTAQQPAAHDTAIEVDGDTYHVRRDFDLMRRIEQAFGPLAEVDRRLRETVFAADDLAKFYRIALKAQQSRPPDDVIEQHIADAGVPEVCAGLALLVTQLFNGHKRTMKWLEIEQRKLDEAADGGGGEGAAADENPTLQAAISDGIATLRRQRTWDGNPPSSGAPRSTISQA